MNTLNAIKKKLLAPIEPGNRTPLPARWRKYHDVNPSARQHHTHYQDSSGGHHSTATADGYHLIQEKQPVLVETSPSIQNEDDSEVASHHSLSTSTGTHTHISKSRGSDRGSDNFSLSSSLISVEEIN